MSKLRLMECFGGIGACSKALERLGIDYEIADYVEIDKFAVASFNAMHGTNFEPQDIRDWNKNIPVDFIMHGSPGQDFSVAGKNAGGEEGSGTRSSLMYETLRIVDQLRPKYVLWENVKNLLSTKHKPNWDKYCHRMAEMGYVNTAKVLNAKDYGIPQNRERVYTLSIRKDIIVYDDYNSAIRQDQDTIGTLTTNCGASAPRNGWKIIEKEPEFKFPEPIPLEKRLKDVLESNVDEKYYLNDEQVHKMTHSSFNSERGRIKNPDEILSTIRARDYKGPQCVKVADTPDLRIRKLTPKECWRLMGFDDSDFEKAAKVNSNAQLYKQAGNSIVVDVLVAILRELLCK